MKKMQDTLAFMFLSAMNTCYNKVKVSHETSFSSGMYFEVVHEEVNDEMIETLKHKMRQYQQNKEVITKIEVTKQEAIQIFEKQGLTHSVNLFKQQNKSYFTLWKLDGYYGYYLDDLYENASEVKEFYMYQYEQGIWLSTQDDFKIQPKLFETFNKGQRWGNLVKVSYIDELNECVKNDQLDDLVLMSESLYEINIHEIAKDIVNNYQEVKFVLIAGPSSAGKTTTSKRLCNHLRLLGKKPITIEMDAFYKTNDMIEVQADGQRDFESFDAFDDILFNETLVKMLNHEEVYMPIYHFGKGIRSFEKEPIVLDDDHILIIEGIHGLNPKATKQISDDKKYKIYINALTHININEQERIKTNEIRLIRRMHRDMLFRNTSLQQTLTMWDNVRKGERENIFPYQEEANRILNTSLCYELPILKKYLNPYLEQLNVQDERIERMKHLFSLVEECDSLALPRHSILAEFIGNSIFK